MSGWSIIRLRRPRPAGEDVCGRGPAELWSRKPGTTGFNAQLVCLLDGEAVYISDPPPGKTHDATAFTETAVAEIVRSPQGLVMRVPVRHPLIDNSARLRAPA